MVSRAKGSKKRSTSEQGSEPSEGFTVDGLIDVPSDVEYSGDSDEDVEEGDFDEVLKKMAEDQGLDSDLEEIEDDADGETNDYIAGDSVDEESEEDSDINSSDIEGASSSDLSEDESGSGSEDDSGLRRISTQSSDGQETAVAHSDTEENSSADEAEHQQRLTIADFGTDLEGWKSYRKSLPKIDAGYASDSSTEEAENTIGNVPIEWYEDYPHVGYDMDGKRIMKAATTDELDKFLANMDDPDVFRTARDESMQRDVKLSNEEVDIIRRIQGGSIPDGDYNPYEDTVEWFTSKTMDVPLRSAPLSKRSFVTSKWEHNRIMKIVRAIRQGRITARAPPKEPSALRFYDVWADTGSDSAQTKRTHHQRLPAPRLPLPTHEESYHPPSEYLPTADEIEDGSALRKHGFLPQDFGSLRTVPGYNRFIQERFQRCLDLYMAPRMLKKPSAIDVDDLMPKLPDPRDLKPFPNAESLVYRGHTGRVRSISLDPTGQWIISGSDDNTIRMWELITGRCARIWNVRETVHSVAWSPNPDVCLFAAAVGSRMLLVVPDEVCDDQRLTVTQDFVRAGFSSASADDDDIDDSSLPVSWDMPTSAEQADGIYVSVAFHKTVKNISWHRRGDYVASHTAEEGGSSVLIHQITKHKSQRPFRKLKGAVQTVKFHPTKPWFLVATQRYVRIYNLMQQELVKTLQPGVQWISSFDVHPQGDNVIVGSYDKKLSWFDLDLSVKPYKSIRYHKQAIRQTRYSNRFPLFATASDDGSLQVYHGMVYQDLNQNPLIVPLKILRGHEIRDSLGVLDCIFHPIQPWLISAGADGTIRLWT